MERGETGASYAEVKYLRDVGLRQIPPSPPIITINDAINKNNIHKVNLDVYFYILFLVISHFNQ